MVKPKTSYRLPKSPHLGTIPKIMLILIAIATVLVIFSTLFAIFFNPERQVKSKIDALASNYYENIFYQNIQNSKNFSGNIEETLQKYQATGFSSVSLNQLILENSLQNTDTANYLLKYCDLNQTLIKIFPDPPYTQTSYHIEYTYSCEF